MGHQPRTHGRASVAGLLLFGLAVAVLVVYQATMGSPSDSARRGVEVPDLVGLDFDDAQEEARLAGLALFVIGTEASTDKTTDTVVEQRVEPGQEVDVGTEVGVIIVAGSELVEVPDLLGRSERDAYALIRGTALTIGVVTTASGSLDPTGTVTDQFPHARARVPLGSMVHVVISLGPAPP